MDSKRPPAPRPRCTPGALGVLVIAVLVIALARRFFRGTI